MLCLVAAVLLAQVTHPITTAHVTTAPSLLTKLDRLYQKLEQLAIPKNPITLSDDEEELLSAMQVWGDLNATQLSVVAKDLQRMKDDADDDRTALDLDYAEMDDEEYSDPDYHNDGKEDEDDEDDKFSSRPVSDNALNRPRGDDLFSSLVDEDTETSSSAPQRVTPLAFTKEEPLKRIISAVDPISATNQRPRILDDSGLTAMERKALRTAALENIGRAVRLGNCLVPQPRWLSVRQLAPSSDTMFMPPCVELHRCAPDSGCCNSEVEVCAPIEGHHVAIPFYVHKADGNNSVARMVFYNHTTCACVHRDTLQSTVDVTHSHVTRAREERQNDWRPPTPAQATVEPKLEEDVTAPPQMRRCTCPKFFLAKISDSGSCSCACDWPDMVRRRGCLFFSKGKEHLGLSDRVCIEAGDCAPPGCEYGAYDRHAGRCPARKYRRLRYQRRHQEKNVV